MSNRNLTILGLVTVVMIVWAVVQSGLSSRPYAPGNAGAYLVQGLDPAQVARITVGTGSEPLDSALPQGMAKPRGGEHAEPQVILTRRGANFVVAGKDNYPALVREINKLITTCLDIRTAELYTDNPANHKDLGVTEENARIVVKFYRADSSLLTGVVIGNPAGQDRQGGYVRLCSDNRVYLTTAQIPWIKKRAMDYIEQELTSARREDVNSVTVSCPNETYVLRPGPSISLRPGSDDTIVLDNLPEGKKLKDDVAVRVFTALANLKFDDVCAESSRPDLVFYRRYVCRLKDSTVYTFWLAKDADNGSTSSPSRAQSREWLVKCDARFADKTPVTKTQGEVESEDQLKIKEAKLLARDAAEEFAEKHEGWVYQIPDYKAENLTSPLADLLEDLATADKQEQPEIGGPPDANDEPAEE